jgi:hypothetical protein
MAERNTGRIKAPKDGFSNANGVTKQGGSMKTILMMLLAVVSSSAAAEWVKVSENEAATTYADPTTISKAGNMVKMWRLIDLRKAVSIASDKPFISSKGQEEYDCKEEQSRVLALTFHSENMGGGEVVHSEANPTDWAPVRAGSIGETLWKFGCGKP